MKKYISCVAFDLDGTLLSSQGTDSEGTREILGALQRRGCLCTIATGRMFRSAAAIAEDLSLREVPLITYNGSLVKVPGEHSPIFTGGIPRELAGELLRFCCEQGWYVQSYLEDQLLVEKRSFWTEYYEKLAKVEALPLGEAFFTPSKDPLKILLAADSEEQHALMVRTLGEHFGHQLFLAGSQTPGARFLEVVARGINKGKALEKLCQAWNIPLEETLVFGDSENDLPLFEHGAYSVAMGNAAPEIQKKATFLTESNDREGIALFFEKHEKEFTFGASRISRSA
jgi:Cof subfamily protein (haloacid dehalogenase superfamily)